MGQSGCNEAENSREIDEEKKKNEISRDSDVEVEETKMW